MRVCCHIRQIAQVGHPSGTDSLSRSIDVKVFISWSKPRSKMLAELLRDWLPEVIQQVQPWISSADIDKGQRWANEVSSKLSALDQGLLCLTPENQHEPWLNFEAGALAKAVDESRVRPVLLDLKPANLTGPIAQFQAAVASDRDDMWRVVHSLNQASQTPLESHRLERAFERLWRDFSEKVEEIRSASAETTTAIERPRDDILAEVLERVREIQRSLTSRGHDTQLTRGNRFFTSTYRDVYRDLPSPADITKAINLCQGTRVVHKVIGPGEFVGVAPVEGDDALQFLVKFDGQDAAIPITYSQLSTDEGKPLLMAIRQVAENVRRARFASSEEEL
jgi:hypothetical protein